MHVVECSTTQYANKFKYLVGLKHKLYNHDPLNIWTDKAFQKTKKDKFKELLD